MEGDTNQFKAANRSVAISCTLTVNQSLYLYLILSRWTRPFLAPSRRYEKLEVVTGQ